MSSLAITGRKLARNALVNFVGQVSPLLVGLVALPILVEGLGTERFGLLSLAWVLLGYLAIFDVGLGRATTKFVAEALARGEFDRLPALLGTAIGTQAILGILGAVLLIILTPFLVTRVFDIPPAILIEAEVSFRVLAIALPFVLISSSFQGILEAVQRFDLVNLVRIPTITSVYLLPLIGIWLGWGLPGILVLLASSKVGMLMAYRLILSHAVPNLRISVRIRRAELRNLLTFGGWVTVSSVVGPVLVYSDRFIIAAVLTAAAVTHYTVPYEVISRLYIVPVSLVMVLIPAYSALAVNPEYDLGVVCTRGIKFVFLLVGPSAALLAALSAQFLKVWMGSRLAAESVLVLQILSFGVLAHSMAHVPWSLLQGIGKPSITAKFHLAHLPIYLILVWILVYRLGIVGAAIAWSIRAAADGVFHFVVAWRLGFVTSRRFKEIGVYRAAGAVGCLALVLIVLGAWNQPLVIKGALMAPVLLAFGAFVWWRIFDLADRGIISSALGFSDNL